MSPVKAPPGSGWQSWAPSASLPPLSFAGGLGEQRRRRADGELGLARFARVGRPAHRLDLARARPRGRSSSSCRRRTGARQGSSQALPASGLARLLSSRFTPMQSAPPSLDRARPRPKTTRFEGAADEERRTRRMLEAIRNAAQGVVGKAIMTVVMGLIIVSFVIWGVGDMLRGFTDFDRRLGRRARRSPRRNTASPTTGRSSNISAGCAARSPTRRRARSASTAASCSGCSAKRRSTRRRASSASTFPTTPCARSSPRTRISATSPARSTPRGSPARCATWT